MANFFSSLLENSKKSVQRVVSDVKGLVAPKPAPFTFPTTSAALTQANTNNQSRVVSDLKTAGYANPKPLATDATPYLKARTPLNVEPSTVSTQNFFTDIVKSTYQAPAREAASLVLQAKKVTGGNETYQPSTRAERAVLGDKPIQPLNERLQGGVDKARELGLSQKSSALLGPLAVVGSIGLNLSPGTPGKKKLAGEAAEIVGKQGIAGAKRLNVQGVARKAITETAEAIRPELEAVRGAKLTHQEIAKAAETSDVLRKVTTRAETLRREAAILKTRQHLAALAEGKGVSGEFVDTLRVVSAEASNLGRQLQSLTVSADPELNTIKSKVVKHLLDTGIESERIIKAAEGVDFTNQKQVTDFYRQFVKPRFGELLDEYRYTNLLSSPKTHIVNAFSNLMQVGLVGATKLSSGAVDAVASALTGKARQQYASEVAPYAKGVANSVGEALTNMRQALKGETLIERPDLDRIPTGNRALSIIPRILEAGDVFFRTLVRNGELESLAYRYGKQGKEITDAVRRRLLQEAKKKAEYAVFRAPLDPANQAGQGKLLSAIDKATTGIYSFRNVPGVKWFIPFVQTPMNILKQGIEYSPLGFATLPGATDKTGQIGKALLGSTVFAGAGALALQGRATWSTPTTPTERSEFFAAGRQPYSVKVGDKWVSYSRLGPLAYPIAMAAAIAHYSQNDPGAVDDSALEKTMKSLRGIVEFFADQSYLEGIGDLVDIVKGQEYAAGKSISNVPSQLIPLTSLLRWTSQLIDPIYRKPKSGISTEAIIQNLQAGIPFLTKKLPAYEDPTGRPSQRKFPVFNAVSPVSTTPVDPRFEGRFQRTQDRRRRDVMRDARRR